SVPPADEHDVGALARRTRALLALAGIDLDKGNYDDARAEDELARALAERWWALAPVPEAGYSIVRALTRMGSVAIDRGATRAGGELDRAAGARLDRALALYPRDATLRRRRAGLQLYLGHYFWKLGDHARGRAEYLRGAEVAKELYGEQGPAGDGAEILGA